MGVYLVAFMLAVSGSSHFPRDCWITYKIDLYLVGDKIVDIEMDTVGYKSGMCRGQVKATRTFSCG
jgi:hypothetical protein